ncbi:hypothetical protein Sphch_1934 [Sphingobium chlorophenolicum L-1]|uniref:Uncharacterized protein n=1 Tax=Sphingobium chlorophenolicum L-1 TaxID=690566 RepID=F6EUS8_SPHCR|nr:hypothetical protein [Sphingobium chlorophenolicum]AEG49611.1 hypothetical protein Sphch_1934 [Sphingobium chlorophenolicum L-1]
MTKHLNLSELDIAVAAMDGAWPVPPLPLNVGGVDPLGLRQLNFGLMDRCIPGLNNAAWRLRPYVVMAWAWWQAARLADRNGLPALPVMTGRRFADRVEVIFQAGHLVAGEFGSLPGSEGIQARVVSSGGIDFSTPEWDAWHLRRREQGSLMAPVSYGPSVKEGLGMGFLRSSGGLFSPVDEVMPAVLALDECLATVRDNEAFSSLECGWVPLAFMEQCHPLWRMDEATTAEIEVGRAALLGTGGSAARSGTLALVRSILGAATGPLNADEIRIVAARSDMPWSDRPVARLWRAMQARQLLRIGLEGLLNWVLAKSSDGPISLDALTTNLIAEIDVDAALPIDDWLTGECPSADGLDGRVSPASLLDDIDDVRQFENAELCASGLRASLQICREMDGDEALFGGQPDRLPLARLSERLRSGGALPMRDACELIISELLIGQHVYWAIGRSGDDTQRLRIVLDEGGWVALHGAGHANPTPDRLFTLLELGADCGLVERVDDGYVRAGAVAALPGEEY